MKLRFISLLLAAALIICGCSKTDGSEDIPQPDDTVYGEPDVTGVNVTYIKTESGFVPISLVKDGHSMLSGENYYYDLVNIADSDDTLDSKPLTAFDMGGINLGVVTLDKDSSQPYANLITSGNWRLCPAVRHSASEDDGYKQFIMETFSDRFTSTADITVTDIAECDLDGDGTNEAVVTAEGENYTVLAMLSQSMGNRILASSFDNPDYNARAYVADLDGNGAFSLVTVAGDSFNKLTVFKENSPDTDYTVYLPLN